LLAHASEYEAAPHCDSLRWQATEKNAARKTNGDKNEPMLINSLPLLFHSREERLKEGKSRCEALVVALFGRVGRNSMNQTCNEARNLMLHVFLIRQPETYTQKH
jgi:hypothetical protein